MAKVIGVRFKNTAKTYYFAPLIDTENQSLETENTYKVNDGVIVETAEGVEYGTIVFGIREINDSEIKTPLKPILRKATEKDKKTVEDYAKKIPEAMAFANEKIHELNLEMKLIGAEFAFDGKKLSFFFSSEKRIDFRELVKVLASKFHTRIDLRQVGIRDETKILGGIAPCGRTCCCAGCMPDFCKVSIKMAKNQGLHLNPSKISGLCGRLMCCLSYENDYYASVYGKMPKVGGTVSTPEGDGIVVSNDMLKLISKIKITKPDGSEVYKDFPVDRLEFKRKQQQDDDEQDNSEDIIQDDDKPQKQEKKNESRPENHNPQKDVGNKKQFQSKQKSQNGQVEQNKQNQQEQQNTANQQNQQGQQKAHKKHKHKKHHKNPNAQGTSNSNDTTQAQ